MSFFLWKRDCNIESAANILLANIFGLLFRGHPPKRFNWHASLRALRSFSSEARFHIFLNFLILEMIVEEWKTTTLEVQILMDGTFYTLMAPFLTVKLP
jgi:hypothetical protein